MITIKSNKVRWTISGLLALLILFGTFRNVFSLAAFLIMGLMLVFCDKETNLLQIFFVMPLANIFKLSPDAQSFFTIVILVYVVLHLVLPRKATFIVILFAIYVVIGQLLSGELYLFRAIKFIFNFLFLSSVLNDRVEVRDKEIYLSYIVGNLFSSIFGLLDSSYFKIENYIGVAEFGDPDSGELVTRFTGLYADPNYYTVGIIVSLCLVVVLLHRKEISGLFCIITSVSFIYFLILTYSKSAIIMLALPFFVVLYSFRKKGNYFSIVILLALLIVAVIMVFTGKIDALDIVIERFLNSETTEGVDIDSLTTGRLSLWIMYSEHLLENIEIGFFGSGIGSAVLGRPSHNTYIDIIYYLGAFGGVLLFAILIAISEQSRKVAIKRNIMNYSVIMCIVIMYFFLSELFYFDPPFHIYLAITVLNTPMNSLNTAAEEKDLRYKTA